MNLPCHLLGHRVARHAVDNQGFRFSRCRRCRRDMIRSVAPASSKWIAVPGDLRIAWNGVDADALAGPSWHRAMLRRAGPALSGAVDVLRIGVPLLTAAIAENLHRACHNFRLVRAPLRLTHIAQPKRHPKQWRMSATTNLRQNRAVLNV